MWCIFLGVIEEYSNFECFWDFLYLREKYMNLNKCLLYFLEMRVVISISGLFEGELDVIVIVYGLYEFFFYLLGVCLF